jgi:murein L,D-transpeptidase YafK
MSKLTNEVISAAILGFEEQKRHIDSQIAELRAMLSGGPAEPAATKETSTRKRRKFSAAARMRMKEAQQRRWAAIKGTSEPPSRITSEAAKPKRRISEEGMKRIIAATKKRWRLQKAQATKAQSAGRKAVPARKKASVRKAVKKVGTKKKAAAASTLASAQTAS